jgi:hypothetical protein
MSIKKASALLMVNTGASDAHRYGAIIPLAIGKRQFEKPLIFNFYF